MGIREEGCYGALDSDPVLDQMERKTALAFKELTDPESKIQDGSMLFKEKFAEISRLVPFLNT